MTDTKLSGRELDAAVAERIFGWQWWERPSHNGKPRKGLFPPLEGSEWEPANFSTEIFQPAKPGTERFSDWDRCAIRHHPNGRSFDVGLPHYRRDPAAMMDLIDKLESMGLSIQITCDGFGKHVAIFAYEETHEATGVTMMEAVALAALRAVRVAGKGR